MHPNEILPAIPRQKVKNNCIIGKPVADVFCTVHSEDFDFDLGPDAPHDAIIVKREDGSMDTWQIDDCEPVPEEPRPFRCGDAVFVRGSVVPGEDADKYGIYSRISGISKDGQCKIVDRLDWVKKDGIRLATHQELAKYF